MHCTLEVFFKFSSPALHFIFVWVFREMIWAREPKWGGEGRRRLFVLEVEILECAIEWEGKH